MPERKRFFFIDVFPNKDTLLGDTRESAAIYICQRLLEEGARLAVYDPVVDI